MRESTKIGFLAIGLGANLVWVIHSGLKTRNLFILLTIYLTWWRQNYQGQGLPREQRDDDVGEDGPLVRLVDDDDRILGQQKVSLDLAKQDSVRHEPGNEPRPVFESQLLMPALVGQGCWFNSWTATLMDGHTLGKLPVCCFATLSSFFNSQRSAVTTWWAWCVPTLTYPSRHKSSFLSGGSIYWSKKYRKSSSAIVLTENT